jgi:acetyl-CoA acetyltransferase
MNKPVYIAAYHQSEFGKLMGMTVPEIIGTSVREVCQSIGADAASIDVGSVGATCTYTLNQQGLLAGLLAAVPGMAGKPIESVENACASGGQAVLSVIYTLLAGEGGVGIAVGFEKMRDREGKMAGKAGVDGECGINTSGGLIAKGHPVGATGVAMIGWSSWQLLGKVPPALQVKNAKAAATFNIGGPICASVCTVLKRAV